MSEFFEPSDIRHTSNRLLNHPHKRWHDVRTIETIKYLINMAEIRRLSIKKHTVSKREECVCCYGVGILSDLYGIEGSCMTCNGKGYFEWEELNDNEEIL